MILKSGGKPPFVIDRQTLFSERRKRLYLFKKDDAIVRFDTMEEAEQALRDRYGEDAVGRFKWTIMPEKDCE